MNKNILDAIKGILYSTEPDGTPCAAHEKVAKLQNYLESMQKKRRFGIQQEKQSNASTRTSFYKKGAVMAYIKSWRYDENANAVIINERFIINYYTGTISYTSKLKDYVPSWVYACRDAMQAMASIIREKTKDAALLATLQRDAHPDKKNTEIIETVVAHVLGEPTQRKN